MHSRCISFVSLRRVLKRCSARFFLAIIKYPIVNVHIRNLGFRLQHWTKKHLAKEIIFVQNEKASISTLCHVWRKVFGAVCLGTDWPFFTLLRFSRNLFAFSVLSWLGCNLNVAFLFYFYWAILWQILHSFSKCNRVNKQLDL